MCGELLSFFTCFAVRVAVDYIQEWCGARLKGGLLFQYVDSCCEEHDGLQTWNLENRGEWLDCYDVSM